MDKCKRFGGKVRFFWFLSLGVFLLIRHAKAESIYEPLKNVNLSPVWKWRSAYECMLNNSDVCLEKDILTLHGLLNVSSSEVGQYCKADGCAQHTKDVLKCIFYANQDFFFANTATVKDINDTISQGCATNSRIYTGDFKASGGLKTHMSLLSSLATLLIISIFNV